MGRLDGKTAMVIGAGAPRGETSNGSAVALRLAEEGAAVFAVDYSDEQLAVIMERLPHPMGAVADATDRDDVARAVSGAIAALGHIDVLYNNVGIGGIFVDLDELTDEQWDRQMTVNVTSMYRTCQQVIPHMVERGSGCIINVSSVTSIRSTGTPYPAYIASKAAVNALTRSIATRYGRDGLRCNAILPGFIDSPMSRASLGRGQFAGDIDAMRQQRSAMVPLGRMGTSEDLAGAAAFLASDEASYISGVLLPVDGGFAA